VLRTLIFWGTGPGSPYYTNLYYGAFGATAAAAAHSATANLVQDLVPITADDLSMEVTADVEEVDPATGLITDVFQQTSLSFAGSNASDPVPWASQVLTRWRTGVYVGGREVRGRTYWPGCVEPQVVGGVLAPAAITAYDLVWSTHLADPDVAAAGDRVIYSPKNLGAFNVNAGQTWNQMAVQRSRRPL
jgi:hypothetical protein